MTSLLLVVALAAGCGGGSRPAPSAQAAKRAHDACVEMLSLGYAVMQGTSVLSTTASQSLGAAVYDANRAAVLAKRWAPMASTIRDVRRDLETDQRLGLSGTLDDLAVDCEPFVATTTTTT